MSFEFWQAFGFPRPFVSADGEEIPDTHRHAVGGEVGGANHEDGELRELPTSDSAHDRERGDDSVVGTEHEVTNVVSGGGGGPLRFDVQ
jgi:hypothetical protein